MALLVRWLLLCAGKLCENVPDVTGMALREQVGMHCSAGVPPAGVAWPAGLPSCRTSFTGTGLTRKSH